MVVVYPYVKHEGMLGGNRSKNISY